MSDTITASQIKVEAQAVIEQRVDWLDVAAKLWNHLETWEMEATFADDRLAWTMIGAMFDYDAFTNPENIKYPSVGGEWTDEQDAGVRQRLQDYMVAYDALNAMQPGDTVLVETRPDGAQYGCRMDVDGKVYGAKQDAS